MATSGDPTLDGLAEDIAARVGARPSIVAIDGPVAAGKTTLAHRLARALEQRGIAAAVVSADGFLWPLARLRALGLVERKGFPESFDREAMRVFLEAAARGDAPDAPAYDHTLYDIAPDRSQTTARAAVVIFEGVNVLQPDLAALYSLRFYLEAPNARDRFIRRFMETPFTPARVDALSPWRPANGDPHAWAAAVWAAVNGPNLEQNIAQSRVRADRVLNADS